MMPAHKAITSGMSLLSAAREVVTVPEKSARGTAYCSTIRFRVGASLEPKSCRRAATKPSRNVTTIGRSALKIMSSTSGHSPAGGLHRRNLRIHSGVDGIPLLDLVGSVVKLVDWIG